MKITAKISKIFEKEKRLKAFVNLYIEKNFLVTGIRVVDCKNGLMVMMPSKKDSNDEYKDICFPITKELREQISNTVLNAYELYLKTQEDEKQ